MDTINRWQDRMEIVVGIWLCLSPYLLGLPEAAAWAAMVVGALVILISVEDALMPNQIEEWGNMVLGLALLASPWVLGYSDQRDATSNAVLAGLVVSGMAGWALERLFRKRHEMTAQHS